MLTRELDLSLKEASFFVDLQTMPAAISFQAVALSVEMVFGEGRLQTESDHTTPPIKLPTYYFRITFSPSINGWSLFVCLLLQKEEEELNVNADGNGLTIILRMIGRDWTDPHSHWWRFGWISRYFGSTSSGFLHLITHPPPARWNGMDLPILLFLLIKIITGVHHRIVFFHHD